MRAFRKSISLALAIPAAVTVVLGMAPQAQADAGTGCPNWEYDCGEFYFNSHQTGSRVVFRGTNVPDLAGYHFLTSGAGKGQLVKNNAASFHNASVRDAAVFFNSGYTGPCDSFAKRTGTARLKNTYNDNASLRFGAAPSNCHRFS
ncbi:hypothetical protein ACIP88_21620 [Streptomyces uncialis]|uniref:hypothetical protein n=1 Tax=Streptomyces uncialis TaxID=1048205 RepID=UPI0038258183